MVSSILFGGLVAASMAAATPSLGHSKVHAQTEPTLAPAVMRLWISRS